MTHATHQPAVPATSEHETQGPSLQQAHALAGRIIAQLTTQPRDIDLKREFHGEYGIQIFWSHDAAALAAFAAWANTTWTLTPSETSVGVYAETRTRVDGVAVWAWTLLSRPEADEAQRLLTPPAAESVPAQASAAPDVTATQPTPTVGTSPSSTAVPAVLPLAAMAVTPAAAVDEQGGAQ
ncbi:hypothetical protein JL475_24530 [Streptomyces sp. M2CJ-2]|uniref:hypothetical protein n=1 Tax=Streptomyces sp. M2CJ-2 TaxID=2803948 RepID=UPI00192659B2|nr:hypothetical protein [Streptomyces sp. M2CJ-2]MBL3669103.1 hypothetical protein [Streptomyces sp. M2CJ-2]